jgi:glutathione reductase (NADPH)
MAAAAAAVGVALTRPCLALPGARCARALHPRRLALSRFPASACCAAFTRALGSRRAAAAAARRPAALAAAARRAVAARAAAASPSAAAAAAGEGSDEYDFDLFCIGAGSGGVRAARVAAGTYGARVGVCEMPFATIASDEAGGAGGTCVLRGCVPKKLFVYASEYRAAFADAAGFGWRLPGAAPTIDWPTFLEKKNAELRRLHGVYGALLRNSGVEVLEGRGRLVGPHAVEVGGRTVTARHVVIATGARAFVPKFEGSELAIISDQALELPALPRAIAIFGGGYIGVEFAGIFAGLGCEVHLFCRAPALLRGFDAEVARFATEQYEVAGVRVHFQSTPTRLARRADGRLDFTVAVAAGAEGGAAREETFIVDEMLAATGRKPNVANLGLETAGVVLTKGGAIQVDEFSRTTAPSVWAIGDVTDRLNLTPVALNEAMALTRTLFGGGAPDAPDRATVPTAVFSQPPIGTVGLSEEEALKLHQNVDVYTSSFRPMKNTISGSAHRALMKVIVDADSDRVLGVHVVGPDAGEIMQGFGVAVKMGATKADLDACIGIHPTAAEELVTMRAATRRVRGGAPVPEGAAA